MEVELNELMFSLRNRTVLVTGATGYLGGAITKAVAAAGAHVLVNGRQAEPVDALVADIRDSGGSAEAIVFDVTEDEEMVSALQVHLDNPLHAIINNAYAGGAGTISTATAQAYRDSYEICLVAVQRLLQVTLPSLRRAVQLSGDASIVNVASMYAHVSPDQRVYAFQNQANPPFYGAAKAALVQWTRYAACELGADCIRVNSISPGPFPSEAVQWGDPDFVVRLSEKVPLRRVGRAAEIAGPVVFLASRASTFVNGADLAVDGGWTAW